ncbi:hypothetical protein MALU111345_22155 [Marinicrinis lubricantis]
MYKRMIAYTLVMLLMLTTSQAALALESGEEPSAEQRSSSKGSPQASVLSLRIRIIRHIFHHFPSIT